ncbi:hypothetical protein KY284_036199 [Solanum tuberosum]|nr:hypothetical protein KY284_036199 [Solanum tuberosum]
MDAHVEGVNNCLCPKDREDFFFFQRHPNVHRAQDQELSLIVLLEDVYKGLAKYIPKLYSYLMCYLLRQDYTRDDVNVDNLLAVLLGNKTALTRYRKDESTGPNDHICVLYSDHGGSGLLDKGMYSLPAEWKGGWEFNFTTCTTSS